MSSVPKVQYRPHRIPVGNSAGSASILGFELDALLASEGHYVRPNGSWSGGGPFYKVHQSVVDLGRHTQTQGLGGVYTSYNLAGVVGVSRARVPDLKPGTLTNEFGSYAKHVSDNSAAYATGWARTRPGNPTANLGQFLLELRDFPQIIGSNFHGVTWKSLRRSGRKFFSGLPFSEIPKEARRRTKWFSSLGEEYLNYDFGWRPFVKDLIDIYRLMKNIDKQMAQLVRDNGRGIRRQCTLRDDSTTEFVDRKYYPYGPTNVYGTFPSYTSGSTNFSVTRTKKVRQWYVAKYSYYIPDTNSWQWNARARAALFGVLPTPALLYEVLPWSWMIDWFANVGDVVSNASVNAVDNLVALYSYVMTNTVTTTSAHVDAQWRSLKNSFYDIPGGSINFVTKRTQEVKFRCGGTPYGLGVSYNGLSPRKLATLAALGLSRSNF